MLISIALPRPIGSSLNFQYIICTGKIYQSVIFKNSRDWIPPALPISDRTTSLRIYHLYIQKFPLWLILAVEIESPQVFLRIVGAQIPFEAFTSSRSACDLRVSIRPICSLMDETLAGTEESPGKIQKNCCSKEIIFPGPVYMLGSDLINPGMTLDYRNL